MYACFFGHHASKYFLFLFLFRCKMNESSIDEFSCKLIPHLVTSSEGFRLLRTVFRLRVNPLNDIFATKINFKNIFLCWQPN